MLNRRRMPQPSPDLQALEQDYQNKVKYAVQKMEGSFEAAFQKLTDEMQGRLDAMNRRHLGCVRRRRAEAEGRMVRHGGVLQPLTGAPPDPREVRHEDVGGIYGQPHPAVPPDVRLGTQPRSPHRHRLQHPVPSHAGERRCVRPVGEPAFEDRVHLGLAGWDVRRLQSYSHRGLRTALKDANADAADTADKDLWRRLMSLHEEFEVFKGKYRGDTPQPQASRGNTPTPEPGPSRFPGSYRSQSPDMSNDGKPQPAANDEPDTPSR